MQLSTSPCPRELNMGDMLDTHFPLPTASVNWNAGWVGALPPYAAELATLRHNCCAAIYEHNSACQSRIGYDAQQTMPRLQRVLAYADKLCAICTDRRSKSGISTKLQQQHHRRNFPLQFEWCFPAEADSLGHAAAECVGHTLPGFEYICLLSCVCIGLTHAAELSRDYGDYPSAACMYAECINVVNTRVKSAVGAALNAAQWNSLHRKGVPMQLLPTWLAVLSAKASHRAQLCAIMHVAKGTSDSMQSPVLVQLTRQAYCTIKFLLRCVRRFLTLEHYLSPRQEEVAKELYNNVHIEAHRLRIQCFLQETEPIMLEGSAPVACSLLSACRESVEVVWPNESTADSSDLELRNQVLETIIELETSASKSSSSDLNCTDAMACEAFTQHERLEALIAQSECLHWAEVFG